MRPFLTLHHPAAAQRYYEQGLWRTESCYALLESHAAARPNVHALRDGTHCLTWSETKRWVDGVAADLVRRGLCGGDRVSIWTGNHIQSVILFLACSREGFACNPSLHRTHTVAEAAKLMEEIGARILLTEPGW
jgi:acyl-CoA synthetase